MAFSRTGAPFTGPCGLLSSSLPNCCSIRLLRRSTLIKPPSRAPAPPTVDCKLKLIKWRLVTPETLTEIAVPPVPLTVEGASVLHQMMRLRRPPWRALSSADRAAILDEATAVFAAMENPAGGRQSAVFSLIGHKGDLLFLHFRRSFEELNQAELDLARLRLSDYLEATTSYLSVIELGLYESTSRVYSDLAAKGVEPHSGEWKKEIEAVLDRQRKAMAPRLWPEIPGAKYVCFYPMDRRRGEAKNWYEVPMAHRKS